MVNAPGNIGYQSFVQPSVAQPDPPARTESVQPRNAPAADSQRGDQKSLASRDEDRPQKQADSDQGRNVDVKA
jgi:hypothetical protein